MKVEQKVKILEVTRLGVAVVEAMEIVEIVTAKSWIARCASSHPAFMGSCLTISYNF